MVYLFLAAGFEEMEAIAPLDILRRAGVRVTTVGVTGKTVCGAHGITVETDTTDIELIDELEMIIMPGGLQGVENLTSSGMVRKAIEFCEQNGKKMAAICAAPTLLAQRGVLSGKRATCFPDMASEMCDAVYTGEDVCVCDNFVTGKSAGHSQSFGIKLVEVLRGKEAAQQVEQALCQNNA